MCAMLTSVVSISEEAGKKEIGSNETDEDLFILWQSKAF